MESILHKLKRSPVDNIQLSLDSEFTFRCHKGVSCFNACCGDLEIFLTPYDIMRMKNNLGISSGEFLLRYTDTIILKDTKVPMIKLKMKDNGRCSFNTESQDGCNIYPDRPVACRYYPIGMGAVKRGGLGGKDFFFLIRESHCKGFEEEGRWTVKSWRTAQEIDKYDDVNKDWIEIILNKRSHNQGAQLAEKSVKMFMMGCYDIDTFREFVFESTFFEIFDIDDDILPLIKENEEELLKLAQRWLLFALYRMPTMVLKEGAATERKLKRGLK